MAVVNPPPSLALPGVIAAATAADVDVVLAFVARKDDPDSTEQAAAACGPAGVDQLPQRR